MGNHNCDSGKDPGRPQGWRRAGRVSSRVAVKIEAANLGKIPVTQSQQVLAAKCCVASQDSTQQARICGNMLVAAVNVGLELLCGRNELLVSNCGKDPTLPSLLEAWAPFATILLDPIYKDHNTTEEEENFVLLVQGPGEDGAGGWGNTIFSSPGDGVGYWNKSCFATDTFLPTEFFNQHHPVLLDFTAFAMLRIKEKEVVRRQSQPASDRQIGGEPDLSGSGYVPTVPHQVPCHFCGDIVMARVGPATQGVVGGSIREVEDR
ncbi:hypothetical protein BDK51DRAFT_35167 [Blyttiomyces helicus]|uniref:Uncharacterized protein n=1 Tax=Blyttiomyces helicus TaxID=388810 RepID=A0A4P9WMT6_9FUNG|nr:hypothetical protein BDK51DRAFT_35167 [Blyttiomyces helicus]|eukprot:RKO94401.1 hypothetical protein BDK51DRAFT_35167 [Blyttiomyces helicus]